jgi:hypothetical protein
MIESITIPEGYLRGVKLPDSTEDDFKRIVFAPKPAFEEEEI